MIAQNIWIDYTKSLHILKFALHRLIVMNTECYINLKFKSSEKFLEIFNNKINNSDLHLCSVWKISPFSF